MNMTENLGEFEVSGHARQRYAQRISGKETNAEINSFAEMNKDKIKTDLNKMIQYGEIIYSGRQSQKDGKGQVVDVYLNDCWVVLVDSKERLVITVYKIDLSLGDDFNRMYVNKMLEKLRDRQQILEEVESQVHAESEMYRELLDDSESQIHEYKTMIKNLEELRDGYKMVLNSNVVKISQANKEVIEVLNSMIGKKRF